MFFTKKSFLPGTEYDSVKKCRRCHRLAQEYKRERPLEVVIFYIKDFYLHVKEPLLKQSLD